MPGRRESLRVKLREGANPDVTAELVAPSGSGSLSSLVDADGLAEIQEGQGDVSKSDPLSFRSFDDLAI